ncbi:dihydroneopterin aldolase [Thiomicrorhabdus aquaedulcis]|uniref:dihydroneopterin aldolase n=1 Tax=Thiomicrorhabdus aquaedulcis TaxID=2211106 RepID=UPI001E61ADE1|nr:dihydroneopterin aldolase [Thiomicrorhabdus aquaedulcis]
MSKLLMDTIFIQGLHTQAIIGIYDWERAQPQPLIFDIDMRLAIAKAAQSDAISDTVDYKQVADEVIELVNQSRFELLESLCEAICAHILAHHLPVQSLRLRVSKPQAVPQATTVGLIIKRHRAA